MQNTISKYPEFIYRFLLLNMLVDCNKVNQTWQTLDVYEKFLKVKNETILKRENLIDVSRGVLEFIPV